MPSGADDIEFLKKRLKRLRERHRVSITEDFDPRWRPSKLFIDQSEAKEERVATLSHAWVITGVELGCTRLLWTNSRRRL